MIKFLKKVADKIAGAIVGALNGIGAAYEATMYYLINRQTGLVVYGIFPAFLGIHIARGFLLGAIEGYASAKNYHQEVKTYYNDRENNEYILEKLIRLGRSGSTSVPTLFLTNNEITDFKNFLATRDLRPQQRKLLQEKLSAYEDYISQTNCPLSGKNVTTLSQPLAVQWNNTQYICDSLALFQHIKRCFIAGFPAQPEATNNNQRIKPGDIQNLSVNTLPGEIVNFVTEVRDTLSSMNRMKRLLNSPIVDSKAGKPHNNVKRNDANVDAKVKESVRLDAVPPANIEIQKVDAATTRSAFRR